MAADRVAIFEDNREAILGLGYRMLGSRAEGEDLVQDTWLRWRRAAEEEIRSGRSWLLKTASRLAIDRLRSAHKQREQYVGPWLPEPWVVDDHSPIDRLEVDETITIALMHALERLSPQERAAFILHDVFGLAFGEVAEGLEISESGARKLASRARSTVRTGRVRFNADARTHHRLLEAFMSASREGDLEGLKRVLAEDVRLVTDGGAAAKAARRVLEGSDVVGRFFVGVIAKWKQRYPKAHARATVFNSQPGLVLEYGGQVHSAIGIATDGERITAIYVHRNPEKLRLLSQG